MRSTIGRIPISNKLLKHSEKIKWIIADKDKEIQLCEVTKIGGFYDGVASEEPNMTNLQELVP